MKTRDVLFWIFAVIQAIVLWAFVSQGSNNSPTAVFIAGPLFAISVIGVEYLIYSKK